MLAFSIPLLPVKVEVGKERKEVASPVPAFDSRDLAIICMSVAVVFSMLAVILLAFSRAQAQG